MGMSQIVDFLKARKGRYFHAKQIAEGVDCAYNNVTGDLKKPRQYKFWGHNIDVLLENEGEGGRPKYAYAYLDK